MQLFVCEEEEQVQVMKIVKQKKLHIYTHTRRHRQKYGKTSGVLKLKVSFSENHYFIFRDFDNRFLLNNNHFKKVKCDIFLSFKLHRWSAPIDRPAKNKVMLG